MIPAFGESVVSVVDELVDAGLRRIILRSALTGGGFSLSPVDCGNLNEHRNREFESSFLVLK